jgi:hypothetical protein
VCHSWWCIGNSPVSTIRHPASLNEVIWTCKDPRGLSRVGSFRFVEVYCVFLAQKHD